MYRCRIASIVRGGGRCASAGVIAFVLWLALGAMAQLPRGAAWARELAGAKLKYEQTVEVLRAEASAALAVRERAAAGAPDAATERKRFDEAGVWPSLEGRDGWKSRWSAARTEIGAAYERALRDARRGAQPSEVSRLEAERDGFLRCSDRAAWMAPTAFEPLSGPRSWTKLPDRIVSVGIEAGASTELSIAIEPSSGALEYAFELDVTRTQGDGGFELGFLDGARQMQRLALPAALFGPAAPGKSTTVHLSGFVGAEVARVDLEGIALVCARRASAAEAADAPRAAVAPERGALRVLPLGATRLSVSNVRWKRLLPIGADFEPLLADPTPRADVGATPGAALRPEARALLAQARQRYETTVRELCTALEREIDAHRKQEQDAVTSAADASSADAARARATRLAQARDGFDSFAEWPDSVLPSESSARRREWEAARGELAAAYAAAQASLGGSPAELAERASLQRDSDALRTVRDVAAWRPFAREAMRGVAVATPREWIGQNALYTSPRLAAVESTRVSLVATAELPRGEVEYEVELAVERVDGTGGFTLAWPDSTYDRQEFHVPASSFGSASSRSLRVFAFVCAGYVRLDIDGVSVFPERRDASAGTPASPTSGPIEIEITPDDSTQLRVTNPVWKPLRPLHLAAGRVADSASNVSTPDLAVAVADPREVQRAIRAGLRWLARHRNDDGSWSPTTSRTHCWSGSPCFDAKEEYNDLHVAGITALAILSFLEAGYLPASTDVLEDTLATGRVSAGTILTDALQWLVAREQTYGRFTGSKAHMYDEAFATLALARAYERTQDERWKAAAQRGVTILERGQRENPSRRGRWGWRYESASDYRQRLADEHREAQFTSEVSESDTSVTTACINALQAAKRAGLTVIPDSTRNALDFIVSVTAPDGRVGYIDRESVGSPVKGPNDVFDYHVATMSALGMISRILVAPESSDPMLELGARLITADPPRISGDKFSVDYYYWHEATLALSRFDGPQGLLSRGKYWTQWRPAALRALLDTQASEPLTCRHGGWLMKDRWSYVGGPIYSTALNVLTLELLD